MYKSSKRYNIKYLNKNTEQLSENTKQLSKTTKYLNVDEETMFLYYDKIIDKTDNTDRILSLEKYKKNVKNFNLYMKDIAIFINKHDKLESKKYMENLIGINDIESDIMYSLFDFANTHYESIESHEFIKKGELIGGGGKTCTTLGLVLDVGGMVPGLGMAVDAFSVAVSLYCGDFFGAFLGMLSIIPVAGWATGAIEIIRSAVKLYFLIQSQNKGDDDDDDDEEEDDE